MSDQKTGSRRPPGEGGIRQRSPGSWQIKFDIGRDPASGRRLVRCVTVRGSRKKALEELARYRQQLRDGMLAEPGKITVAEHLRRWLDEHARHRVSRKTLERYAEIVNRHLIPSLGNVALTKLAPMHIQTWHSSALTSGYRRRFADGTVRELGGLSAMTVRHCHKVLSNALKHAVRLRLIARNPAKDVAPPRPARREMKILDQAQTAALLKAIEASPIYMPVLLAVTTGMRRSEIMGLRWRDVDLPARVLSVQQALEESAAGLAFKGPKTERSRRTIALGSIAVEALKRHRARQAEERLKAGPVYADHDLVCCDALGDPVSPHRVSGAFARLAARLGLAIRFHDLRHGHISHLLAAGVHPKVAAERAGHANVATTMDVYSHVLRGMQEEAADRVDAALRAQLDRVPAR